MIFAEFVKFPLSIINFYSCILIMVKVWMNSIQILCNWTALWLLSFKLNLIDEKQIVKALNTSSSIPCLHDFFVDSLTKSLKNKVELLVIWDAVKVMWRHCNGWILHILFVMWCNQHCYRGKDSSQMLNPKRHIISHLHWRLTRSKWLGYGIVDSSSPLIFVLEGPVDYGNSCDGRVWVAMVNPGAMILVNLS